MPKVGDGSLSQLQRFLRRFRTVRPWRPRILEHASRRARLCLDAHLSRDERYARFRPSPARTQPLCLHVS